MCVILGAVIEILDLRYPVELTKFFGVDPLQAEELEEGNGMYHLMLLYINELFFFSLFSIGLSSDLDITLHSINTVLFWNFLIEFFPL